MIREIDIKVYYELDANEDEYSDIITPPNTIVEDRVYDKMCDNMSEKTFALKIYNKYMKG